MKLQYLLFALFLLPLCSCGGHHNASVSQNDSTTEARLLAITKNDGYTLVEVADPWNEGKVLDRYVLIPRGNRPDTLPEGTVIEVPLRSAVVYSSVHTFGLEMLGAEDAVTGVADAQYFSKLPNEKVVDIGSALSPSIEKLITLAPEAILLSPYQNSGFGDVAHTSIPIIQMADYMENTPLGRAEWLKFLGLLFGKEHEADSVYNEVAAKYMDLAQKVEKDGSRRPKVLTEQLTSGVWYVPGGRSYMAHLLHDAGGEYPWSADTSTGSVPLSVEEVLATAGDADIWLLRTYGYDESRKNMLTASDLYRHFKPFTSGGIYGCNTAATNIFDIMAFRPDSVLGEYVRVLHPGMLPGEPKFFHKVD